MISQSAMFFLSVLAFLFFDLSTVSVAASDKKEKAEGVKISESGEVLRIEINGDFFSEYHFKDVTRPYLYPVMGPDEVPLTRNWPMKETPDEEHDHPHHKSLWYAHGSINGHDFWSEEKGAGKTVHEKFIAIKSGRKQGSIQSRNKLVALDGTVVATDERTWTFYSRPDARMFDFAITIHASQGELKFGDTKEGTMAIRLNEAMRLKGKIGHGHIVNSEGVQDGETWGKRADWCDYSAPVDGHLVGVAIFDHPANPRHPTWWHVRDYGLFAANPFGIHEFEKKPAGSGDLIVPAGKSITFHYRFYCHKGDDKEAKVAEEYANYAKTRASH